MYLTGTTAYTECITHRSSCDMPFTILWSSHINAQMPRRPFGAVCEARVWLRPVATPHPILAELCAKSFQSHHLSNQGVGHALTTRCGSIAGTLSIPSGCHSCSEGKFQKRGSPALMGWSANTHRPRIHNPVRGMGSLLILSSIMPSTMTSRTTLWKKRRRKHPQP